MNTISTASTRVSNFSTPQRTSASDNSSAASDHVTLGCGGWGNPPCQEPPAQQPPAQQPPAQQPPAQQPPSQQPPSEQPPAEQPPAQQPPSEQPPTDPPAQKKWNILLYSGADNNLYEWMQTDIDEAELIGTTDQMNIIVQTDHAPNGGGGQRLLLEKNETSGVNSPVLQEMGDIDMGKPQTLSDFIKWAAANYPAENTMLVMSDHGGGWPGAISDDSQGGWLTTPQIAQALADAQAETGKKIDVIGFDACLMASAEVAHELKDGANFLVASQETEGGAGWEYNRVFSERVLGDVDMALRTRLNLTPQELATRVVSAAEGNQGDLPTMSATDLSKAADLTAAVGELSRAIADTGVAPSTLSDAANASQTFSGFTDLYDFANNLQTTVAQQDGSLAAAAQKVKDAVENAVVAEQHSEDYPGSHGLHVELSNWSAASEGYGELKFAQDSNWPQAVEKINS